MNALRYTLLSDGASDRALIPILNWLLRQHLPALPIQSEWADLRQLRQPPRLLPARITAALDLYPCDLLFVHRDAEGAPHRSRVEEIETAIQEARAVHEGAGLPPHVVVVPVRMTEAWLLFDEAAIRRAAGNPNGRVPLDLPAGDPEEIPDPKQLLHDLLKTASELGGRRLGAFRPHEKVHRIPEFIGAFDPLRRLVAFSSLEQQVRDTAVRIMGT
jgi:hypothetical protein